MQCICLSTVLLVFIILGDNNVLSLESEKIVGGKKAKLNQFPHQVSIQFLSRHFCGGTLIKPNLVLSAAHCFIENATYRDRPFEVVAGTNNLTEPARSIAVKKIYFHTDYKNFPGDYNLHDIALLKLEESFDVSGTLPIALAQLPRANETFVGEKAVVSGFGFDRVRGINLKHMKIVGTSSGELKYEFVHIRDRKTCNAHKYEGALCGHAYQYDKRESHGPCAGDSGGPLMVGKTVIGIVSTGPNCDEVYGPSVYTEVSHYIDFINNVINDTPTTNMAIKITGYVKFDIPEIKINITTKSAKLKYVLTIMKIIAPKYIAAEREKNKQKTIVNDFKVKNEQLYEALEEQQYLVEGLKNKAHLSSAHYRAYLDEFDKQKAMEEKYNDQSARCSAEYYDYLAKNALFVTLQNQGDNEFNTYKALQKTEIFYYL